MTDSPASTAVVQPAAKRRSTGDIAAFFAVNSSPSKTTAALVHSDTSVKQEAIPASEHPQSLTRSEGRMHTLDRSARVSNRSDMIDLSVLSPPRDIPDSKATPVRTADASSTCIPDNSELSTAADSAMAAVLNRSCPRAGCAFSGSASELQTHLDFHLAQELSQSGRINVHHTGNSHHHATARASGGGVKQTPFGRKPAAASGGSGIGRGRGRGGSAASSTASGAKSNLKQFLTKSSLS